MPMRATALLCPENFGPGAIIFGAGQHQNGPLFPGNFGRNGAVRNGSFPRKAAFWTGKILGIAAFVLRCAGVAPPTYFPQLKFNIRPGPGFGGQVTVVTCFQYIDNLWLQLLGRNFHMHCRFGTVFSGRQMDRLLYSPTLGIVPKQIYLPKPSQPSASRTSPPRMKVQ